MSVRTFTRRFREETGLSPARWLIQQRVEHARQLLETTDLAVDAVARRAGLGTATALRQHLQAAIGVAPSGVPAHLPARSVVAGPSGHSSAVRREQSTPERTFRRGCHGPDLPPAAGRAEADRRRSAAVDAAAEEAQRSGRSVRAVLINDQVVTEEQLTEAAAARVRDQHAGPGRASPPTRRRSSASRCRWSCGTGCSAWRSNDDELVVGVTDPGDVVALDDVRAATGMTVRPVVVARSELRRIIDRLQREDSDLGDVADEPRADDGPA